MISQIKEIFRPKAPFLYKSKNPKAVQSMGS